MSAVARAFSARPKPWTVRTAIALLDAFCILAAALQVYVGIAMCPLVPCSCCFLDAYVPAAILTLLCLFATDWEVRRGHRLGRGLATLAAIASLGLLATAGWREWIWVVPKACPMLIRLHLLATPGIVASPGWGYWFWIAPLACTAVLLHLPPSRRWFAEAVRTGEAHPVPAWRKIVRAIFGATVTVPVALAAMFAIVLLPGIPGERKYDRLCSHRTQSAFLAAEADEIVKIVEFSEHGLSGYTAVVLPGIGFMASGPSVFIFDGRRPNLLVDHCWDLDEDDAFARRWPSLRAILQGPSESERRSP